MAAATMQRPKTAAPSYSWAKRSGQLAISAGVPVMFGPKPTEKEHAYNMTLQKAVMLNEHALKRFSPYAQKAYSGWVQPGLEASIKPKASVTGAGVVSAGSIDNTYMPAPLQNAWGKARELAVAEVFKPPRKQATDLLAAAKGAAMPAPLQGIGDMKSVRPTYSKTIPLFHPIDPQRFQAGFVRSPNIIPGAAPPPGGVMNGITDTPTVPSHHALLKLAYDQSLHGKGRIPVARIVRAQPPARPHSAAPNFLTRAAGLPGGLSLTD